MADEAHHRVLILEDRPEDAELAAAELRRNGFPCTVKRVDTQEGLLEQLSAFDPEVVLMDFAIPGLDGLESIRMGREARPDLPLIVYSGSVSEETAVACLKAGAQDYVLKDRPIRLVPAVESAIAAKQVQTARDRAERELRESEERFRNLVETAEDSILSFDGTGTIEFWNRAAAHTFGFPSSEMAGTSLEHILAPGDSDKLLARVRDLRPEGRTGVAAVPLELRGIRRDGETFPMEVSVSSWMRQDGVHFHAIIRDISERHQARQALEELSTRYETLLNSAGEGILGLELDGTVSFANPAAQELLGRPLSELRGADLHPLIHEPLEQLDLENAAKCPVLESLAEGLPFRGTDQFYRPDGTALAVALSCTPILERGQAGGAVLIFEDITEQKEREEALRSSEAQYRGLVEHATYGIYRSTAAGKFLSVNPALVEMLGFESKEELLGVDMAKELYFDPKDRDRLVEKYGLEERAFSEEVRWKKKDGTPIWVTVSGRGIGNPGRGAQVFEGVVEDLTERRMLEEQLRQAQKMEAVGQLTGGIAHDFNNVLAVILLNAELMASLVEAGAEVELADIRAIQEAGNKAASITRKLLGFSRKAELQTRSVVLANILEELTPMLRTLLPERIELQVDPGEERGRARVDAGSMEQIILNLVSNSRDAISDTGNVTVRLHAVDLGSTSPDSPTGVNPGAYWCLEVSDDGEGMDDETRLRLFDPFFTTKEPGSGTGLGMSMVYGLTKQQDGAIDVVSQPGVGTTIRLYFPSVGEDDEDELSRIESHTGDLSSATVLLVEDDPGLQRTAASALRRRGCQVLVAGDGEEGLERFLEREAEIDLVLSDLVLPRMSGLDLYRALRTQGKEVPFVLSSGYSGDHVDSLEIRDGLIPFLRKPWTLDDLLSTVSRALRPISDEGGA